MSDPTTTKTCLPSKAVAETAQSKAAVQSNATTEATPLLEVRHLTKHYPGFTLDDITFAIAPGRITGFIGRNGAGKSTTLKCVEGAVHPDSGTIAYFGRPFAGNEHFAKQRTGFELGPTSTARDGWRPSPTSRAASTTTGTRPSSPVTASCSNWTVASALWTCPRACA